MRFDQSLLTKSGPDLDTMSGAIALNIKEIGDDGTFSGYGSTFNNVDQGRDRVLPGAFAKSLARKGADKIKMLRDHNHTKLVGKWTKIVEDKKGLYCEGQIFEELELGKETLLLMRSGALDALSIGYKVIDGTYDRKTDIRDMIELDLWEISIVTFPMNEQATIDAVKAGDTSLRDVENALRDADIPTKFAKLVALHGFEKANKLLSKACRDGDAEDPQLIDGLKRLQSQIEGKDNV